MALIASYAAQSATTPLAPFDITRRQPGAHDLQIEFYTVAFVIQISTRYVTNGAVQLSPWYPVMKLLDG